MDVMMNMTTEDVRVLREQFAGKLSLEQFVVLLKKTLHDRIHSEVHTSLCIHIPPAHKLTNTLMISVWLAVV